MEKDHRHQVMGAGFKFNRRRVIDAKVDIHTLVRSQRLRLADSLFSVIDTGDTPTLPGKVEGIATFAAAEIERRPRLVFFYDLCKELIRSGRPNQFFFCVSFVPLCFVRHDREINGRIHVMQNVSFSDVTALEAPSPDSRISYGSGPLQFGEFWQPDPERRRGLIMLVHGGCWQSDYGVDHIRPMASTLREHGFAVWAIEYRRLGDEGGGWPGTFEDVAAATDFAQKELRSKFEPVIYMGHSAGGHLALWTASRSRLPKDSAFFSRTKRPKATLSLAGIVDLAKYASGDSGCEKSAAELMGGAPPANPERYALADPGAIGVDHNRTTFFVGTEDSIVPINQLDDIGTSATTQIEGAGHFDLIHPETPAFHRIVDHLARME